MKSHAIGIWTCAPLLSLAVAEEPAELPSRPPAAAPELGELVVEAMKPRLSARLTSEEAQQWMRRDLAEAAAVLPGVSLQRTGARAETMVTVRGFDLRQVPVFIDGIPVYVPYDGYADLGRFSIPEASEIEVSKSLSPVLAGPNALGGLVNIVTRRPQERLEGTVQAGAFRGGGYEAGLSAGGREEKGYWQVDLSWREQDAFRLSDDFDPVAVQGSGRRENSWSEDWRISGRAAWTPAPDDEHVFGFWVQRGEKGNPPYTGDDPSVRVRYWQWPQWDKDTFYLLSRTMITPDTKLELKAHYDHFENLLRSYDDDSYSTQLRPSSFSSYYDDWTAGGMALVENRSLKDTRLAAALHYKRDHHKEWDKGGPRYEFEDETISLGAEAEYAFGHGTSVVAGVRHDWRKVEEAVDTNDGSPLGGDTVKAWNPQVVLRQKFGDDLEGHLGLSRQSRFPTIKDRYSYRMGQALPNPDLNPEKASHVDLGLGGKAWEERLAWDLGLFHSRTHDAIQQVDNVAYDGPTGLFQLRNVGRVDRRGAEASVLAKWTEEVETGLHYAWISAKNRSDSSIRPFGTPDHEVALYARLHLTEWLRVLPSFIWADARHVTSDGKRVGTYASVDLKTEITLPGDVVLGVGITNLLDRNQELDEGFPEPGRSYFLNARYEF